MKRLIPILLLALGASAQNLAIDVQRFLMVRDGAVEPPNVVPTQTEVSALSMLANAAQRDAALARGIVEDAMEQMYTLAAFSNRVGFVTGNILIFGENNTNVDPDAECNIIRFTVSPPANNEITCTFWLWFSAAIDGAPEIITTTALGEGMQWNNVPLSSWRVENNVQVGGVIYNPVYVLEVVVPQERAAFFRALGTVTVGGVGDVFRVYNAIQVGSDVGIDLDITFNGTRRKWVGGVRIEPQEAP